MKFHHKRDYQLIIPLVLLLASTFTVNQAMTTAVEQKIQYPSFAPDTPINVTSNADFVTQGFSGTGTYADPYTLDAFTINVSDYSSAAIIIKNTDDANLLIGKSGKTIDALQTIINRMFSKRGTHKQIFLDIKGYVIQKHKNKSQKQWKQEKPYSRK